MGNEEAVENTDRWDFALLKPSSVAVNGTLILTSSDEEEIALFHVAEESRATGMEGARSSKDINKSFFLSQLLSFASFFVIRQTLSLCKGAANTSWLLFAAKSSWVTFCKDSNPSRKCFSFPVVLTQVL